MLQFFLAKYLHFKKIYSVSKRVVKLSWQKVETFCFWTSFVTVKIDMLRNIHSVKITTKKDEKIYTCCMCSANKPEMDIVASVYCSQSVVS